MKGLLGKIWGGVKGVGTFILRRGPIIAAGLVGLQSITPIAQYAQYALGLLGIFGVQADPNIAAPSGELFAQLALLVGAIRKIWAIVKNLRGKL